MQALFKLTLSFSLAGRATNMDELIDKLPCDRSKEREYAENIAMPAKHLIHFKIQHMIPK